MQKKFQKITVSGLLVKDNKVLLIKRSSNERFLPNYYELPGGKVDFGEHPKESLEREFLEEVNLKIIALQPFRIFTYVSESGKRHTVELVYHTELKDNFKKIKLSEAHNDFKWVTINELNKLQISNEIKINIKEGLNKL